MWCVCTFGLLNLIDRRRQRSINFRPFVRRCVIKTKLASIQETMGSRTTTVTPVEVLIGQAAHEALSDIRFLTAWRTLHGKCPYATGFQSPKFVSTWYDCYRSQWQPVVI